MCLFLPSTLSLLFISFTFHLISFLMPPPLNAHAQHILFFSSHNRPSMCRWCLLSAPFTVCRWYRELTHISTAKPSLFGWNETTNKNDWLTERKCLSHILSSAKNFPPHDMCHQSSLETSDYDDGRTMSCHNHKFTIEQQQQAEKITHSSFLSVTLSFNTIFRWYCARLYNITSSYQEIECLFSEKSAPFHLPTLQLHFTYMWEMNDETIFTLSSYSKLKLMRSFDSENVSFFISIYRITKWERVRQEIQWGQWW